MFCSPTHQPSSSWKGNNISITGLIGIYNADGGFVGEVRYVIGHLLGTAECALCDITHSPIRRKREWDAMVASLATPLTVLHKNELEPDLEAWLGDTTLPLVVGITDTGEFSVVLDSSALESADGSVSTFAKLLASSLEAN